MGLTNFRALFAGLRSHRRMYLMDDRYMTVVAFVEGCDAATERRLLTGFNDWVSTRILGFAGSGFHWSTIVASKRAPALLAEPRSGPIPEEVEAGAADDLLEMLDEFLSTRQPEQ